MEFKKGGKGQQRKKLRIVNNDEKLVKRTTPYNFKFPVEETGIFYIIFSNTHSKLFQNSIENYTFRRMTKITMQGGFLNKYLKYKKKYKTLKDKLKDFL